MSVVNGMEINEWLQGAGQREPVLSARHDSGINRVGAWVWEER